MKTLISKALSTLTAIAAILIACLLAGLGLTVVFYLALFALAVVALGAIIAPFATLAKKYAPTPMGEVSNGSAHAR